MTYVDSASPDRLVEVHPAGVTGAEPQGFPILELKEVHGDRALMIYIGHSEAWSIRAAREHVTTQRPMTHETLKQTIDLLGARVRRIVIGSMPEMNTFTADVVLAMPDGSERHLDWRPSDAVALAVRLDPVLEMLVAEAVLAAPSFSVRVDGWPNNLAVRCSCGNMIRVDASGAEADAEFVEVVLECSSCGQRRHARLAKPPSW